MGLLSVSAIYLINLLKISYLAINRSTNCDHTIAGCHWLEFMGTSECGMLAAGRKEREEVYCPVPGLVAISFISTGKSKVQEIDKTSLVLVLRRPPHIWEFDNSEPTATPATEQCGYYHTKCLLAVKDKHHFLGSLSLRLAAPPPRVQIRWWSTYKEWRKHNHRIPAVCYCGEILCDRQPLPTGLPVY